MKTIEENEMRELKSWIHIHVFGWTTATEMEYPFRGGFIKDCHEFMCYEDAPDYPIDPAAALEVLKVCSKKLGKDENNEYAVACRADWVQGEFIVSQTDEANAPSATAATLELAICLFAKELFGKSGNSLTAKSAESAEEKA